MMIERQEFATEHIHVVKPLRISLNITWYLAACTIWCTGNNCTWNCSGNLLIIDLVFMKWLTDGDSLISDIFSVSGKNLPLHGFFPCGYSTRWQAGHRTGVLTLFYVLKSSHCNIIKRVNIVFGLQLNWICIKAYEQRFFAKNKNSNPIFKSCKN